MQTVKYGIIGLGNMGYSHIKFFMRGEVPNGEVVAIADVKQDRVQRILDLYPEHKFNCYTSGDDLIENADVDAVIIAVPHYFHPPLSIKALKKGINVISEKPAGVYTKQVKEMNEVASNSKALFTMMFNQRTNCVYRKMREIVREGGIGEIKRVNWIITDWYRSQYYYDSGEWRASWKGEGGGVLFNQCPHQLDLLLWVVGMKPKKVHAHCHFGKWHNIEVEDDVSMYFEYENGATGVFITSTADAPGVNRFEILGTKGKLLCEGGKLLYYKNKVDEREHCFSVQIGYVPPEVEVIEPETDGQNPQHAGILRNFTNTLLGKEELFVDGREGLDSVELMDACLLSEWTKSEITLPIDDDLYLEELNKRVETSHLRNSADVVENLDGTYGNKK